MTAVPQSGPLIGDLIAKNMDWPGAEEIASRLASMLPPHLLDKKLEQLPPEAKALVSSLMQQMQQLKQEHDQAVAMVGDKDKDRQIEVMNIKADYDAQMARVQMDYETKMLAAQVKMATDNSVAGDGSKDAADAMLEMQRMRMDTEAKFAKLESDYQRELLKVGKDLQIAQMQAQSKQAEQSQQKGLRRDSDLAKFEKIHEQIQAKLEKLDSSMKDMENTEIVFDRDPKTNRIAKAKRVRRSVQ
jgi:hypothetical protein